MAPPAPPSRLRPVLVAAGLSLLLHLGLVLGLSGVAFLRMAPPIPIEVLPMKKRPPAPPAVEPPKPAAPKPEARKPRRAGDKPSPVARPAVPKVAPLPPPPPVQDLHDVGPASANITLILRGPLLAKSPHRESVDTLLSVLPDYHTLLDGTGLHPFDDLDALLIATPDPRDVTATFLAARHRRDPRIAAIAGRKLGGGDPREVRALGDDLMLLGRPEDLARIALAESAPETDAPPPPELVEARRWLTALRAFDGGPKDAALLLTIADVSLLVRFQGGMPTPRSLRLALSADASPAARLVLSFADVESALAFSAQWPLLKLNLAGSAPLFAGSLDGLLLTQKDTQVELAGRLPEGPVRMLLTFARMMVPRTPSPALPPPPAEAPTEVPQGLDPK